MKINTDNVLLYIEPINNKSTLPIIDNLTIKMFNAMKNHIDKGHVTESGIFLSDVYTKGVHLCNCGKASKCYDFLLKSNICTNSLCVHYLAYHRDEVLEEELKKIENLNSSDKLNDYEQEKLLEMI